MREIAKRSKQSMEHEQHWTLSLLNKPMLSYLLYHDSLFKSPKLPIQ